MQDCETTLRSLTRVNKGYQVSTSEDPQQGSKKVLSVWYPNFYQSYLSYIMHVTSKYGWYQTLQLLPLGRNGEGLPNMKSHEITPWME